MSFDLKSDLGGQPIRTLINRFWIHEFYLGDIFQRVKRRMQVAASNQKCGNRAREVSIKKSHSVGSSRATLSFMNFPVA